MDGIFDGTQAPLEDTLDTSEGEDVQGQQNVDDVDDVEGIPGDTVDDNKPNQDDDGERLYAGKYKSVEELEKAYQHMQQFGTKLSQKLVDLQKQPHQGTPVSPQQPTPQQLMTNPLIHNPQMAQQLAPALAPLLSPIIQQVQQMEQAMKSQAIDNEVRRLESKYDDFKELAPIIPQLMEVTPQLWSMPNPVETAYLLAKSQYAEQNMKQVYNEATKQAYKNQDAKKKAAAIERQKARKESTKTPEESIADDILNAANRGGSIF